MADTTVQITISDENTATFLAVVQFAKRNPNMTLDGAVTAYKQMCLSMLAGMQIRYNEHNAIAQGADPIAS